MRYQISWEAYLTASAGCLLLYYGMLLLTYRMGWLDRRHGTRPQTAAAPPEAVEKEENPGSQRGLSDPGIPQSILSTIIRSLEDLIREASEKKFSKEKFLHMIELQFSSYLDKDSKVLAEAIRIILRYGAISIAMPLSESEIDIALGIHEASP